MNEGINASGERFEKLLFYIVCCLSFVCLRVLVFFFFYAVFLVACNDCHFIRDIGTIQQGKNSNEKKFELLSALLCHVYPKTDVIFISTKTKYEIIAV